MADLQRHNLVEKDADQVKAITALKKGAHLLKYGRRGKPKFCPFRLSTDESTLIWYYGKNEKQLELRHVSRIIPGQRTPIFKRYPRPEKEYQSFSLIYKDRSLDLVCKDKAEAEVWFSGLKALILRGANRKQKNEPKSEHALPDIPLVRRVASTKHPESPRGQGSTNTWLEKHPSRRRLCKAFSDVFSYTAPTSKKISQPIEVISSPQIPLHPNTLPECSSTRASTADITARISHSSPMSSSTRTSTADITVRISHSSALSSSSQGSCTDDLDNMGGVFIWGEGTGEGFMGGGTTRAVGSSISKTDSLLPKPLDLLDVQSVACGRMHAALVTKQGEVFSWGEEEGGRLGHGGDSDISHPKLVETLIGERVEMAACGENHTCAVTNSGDLYTWGDWSWSGSGASSQWVPKRIGGPIAGLHVAFVACGPWHTAAVTSFGQLFTFGDGTFGALGHGDRGCSYVPREVDSLKGMKTVRVACGVWHTAAIVESTSDSEQQQQQQILGGKLFTWGDGDKGQLGHSDTESRLVPECISSLDNTDFCQVACGNNLTVALTTSGRVFTMGNTAHGQLGSPLANGKVPFCVRGKISNSFIEEIACGSHHIAVLNSKSEVYTWGKGCNGQLGHGDIEDRNMPTLVESLKDKQVKSIACGSNFTAVVSLHKWISPVNNSVCSGCNYPFNLIRKQHNCYNCGLVFCKACTSRKSLKTSLALCKSKPYRVCDVCFVKLESVGSCVRKVDETVEKDGKWSIPRLSSVNEFGHNMKLDLGGKDGKWSISRMSSVNEFGHNMRLDLGGENSLFPIRVGNNNNVSDQRTSTCLKSPTSPFRSSRNFLSFFAPESTRISRSISPVPRKITAPSYLKGGGEDLSLEVKSLRTQVESVTGKSRLLEAELERKTKLLEKIIAQAAEEAEKSKAANDVIKSLTAQLKEMSEKVRMDEQVDNYHDPPSDSNTAEITNSDKSRLAQKTKRVVQDEPGVYITLVTFPNGVNELRRVRFSRKRFTEEEAEKWWAENETRVLERHSVESCNRNS